MTEALSVDRELCDGYGNCIFVAPKLFGLDDENLVFLLKTAVEPDEREDALLAVAECPRRAIAMSERDGASV
jgi:ferredoxin